LTENKIVAWMHGRMEFGPRALGNRSILASPLDPYSTENLNAFIKHREPFRKFAASCRPSYARSISTWAPMRAIWPRWAACAPEHREQFAAAILARRSGARARRGSRGESAVLEAAARRRKASGLPVLYNTSFNLFGEPLVCTPRDAVRSFYSSGIDAMLVGNFFLQKYGGPRPD
jgi:carbamoyltransferase